VTKNQVEITAIVVERAAMRYTPAGIEVLSVTLQHTSQQTIGNGLGLAPRTVELQLKAQFFGSDARKAEAIKFNEEYVFTGYLAPMRVGSKALWLMVNGFTASTQIVSNHTVST
jgi:primosomal replication protein N